MARKYSAQDAGRLIRDHREGKFIYYELNTSVLEDIMLWIKELKGDTNHDKEE